MLILLMLLAIIVGSFIFGALFYVTHHPWKNIQSLERYYTGTPSILLDIKGREWGRFQLDTREIVSIKQIPQHVIHAFLAAEDWKFFEHTGISIRAIIRSILINLYKGKRAQGASTITQQLVRLLFFDAQKSFTRKIKEQLLALAVEHQFSKEQILESYLNNIYMGAGIYGVEAAAQRFWSKNISQVTPSQAATLAAIVQSPTRFCLINSLTNCVNRRNLILKRMVHLGFIDHATCEQSMNDKVILCQPTTLSIAPYLKESIRLFLEQIIDKKLLYTAGLKIQTTIDIDTQSKAEEIFTQSLTEFRENIHQNLEGALCSLDTKTGEVRALVGGYNFDNSQFNRAIQARRQIGSIFKPIIYAQALNDGRKLSDIEVDEPFSLTINNQIWSPRNSYRFFIGPMTLARALMFSNNIITIKLFLSIGAEKIISLAKNCGIKGPFNPYPSLALGCVDATLIEATGMINIFGNQGTYCTPHFIRWVKDAWGTKIWRMSVSKEIVIDPFVTQQIRDVLANIITRYKKKEPDSWFDTPAFGKTGTTNDARTCWFVGGTQNLTTGVYIGCDNNQPLGDQVYASKTVLPLWRNFNNCLLNTKISI